MIAGELISRMNFEGTYIEKAETAGPGFINFTLKNNKWNLFFLKIICCCQNLQRFTTRHRAVIEKQLTSTHLIIKYIKIREPTNT